MTQVEQEYQRHMFSLSGSERVLRAVSLFEDVRRILAHQIMRTAPNASAENQRVQLAKRLYPNDSRIDALLENVKD